MLIEVQDECRGLPNGDVSELFRPFEQRSADRMGLGLAFSRWGADANDGRIYACNLPGRGCVFTVDLPRQPVPAFGYASQSPGRRWPRIPPSRICESNMTS
jgi:K+-sensing histidine kinase KdpD